jgi:hypothetical protein
VRVTADAASAVIRIVRTSGRARPISCAGVMD